MNSVFIAGAAIRMHLQTPTPKIAPADSDNHIGTEFQIQSKRLLRLPLDRLRGLFQAASHDLQQCSTAVKNCNQRFSHLKNSYKDGK